MVFWMVESVLGKSDIFGFWTVAIILIGAVVFLIQQAMLMKRKFKIDFELSQERIKLNAMLNSNSDSHAATQISD